MWDSDRSLRCRDCDTEVAPPALDRCPQCDGFIEIHYDLTTASFPSSFDSMWGFTDYLPVDNPSSLGEGATPLVGVPELAETLGVEQALIKDEGQTPTGTIHDRGFAVTMDLMPDGRELALPSTGAAGHSAAAYGARYGHTVHVFQPSRADFISQAMTNVHGADLNVVRGRYADAVETFADVSTDAGWQSVASFAIPYRLEGIKTVAFEVAAALDWTAPDVVIVPEGTGLAVAALAKGFRELQAAGQTAACPTLIVAQSDGCAPLVAALDSGLSEHEKWAHPDTVCPDLEVPDPAGGSLALAAVQETDGTGYAATDEDILGTACWVGETDGPEIRASGAAAVQAGLAHATNEGFAPDDTVVLLNPGAGIRDADIIRSHLMSTEWDRSPPAEVE